jgi:hypothetical protein
MREILVADTTMGVNASALALLFYKQEFNSDLIKDFTKFASAMGDDITNYDGLQLLSFVWALNKAYKLPEKQPGFETWIQTINFDFADEEAIKGVMTEIVNGYFRSKADLYLKAKKTTKKR